MGNTENLLTKHGETGEGRKCRSFLRHCTTFLLIGQQHAPLIIDTSLQSARPDSDEGDMFDNCDTASEDGQLHDADDEASDKSKHSTEEISSGLSHYNTPTKTHKLSKTDRVEKTVQDRVGCIIKKQREKDKYLHIAKNWIFTNPDNLHIKERRLQLEEKMAETESEHGKICRNKCFPHYQTL